MRERERVRERERGRERERRREKERENVRVSVCWYVIDELGRQPCTHTQVMPSHVVSYNV
jgi:hypothetical protein